MERVGVSTPDESSVEMEAGRSPLIPGIPDEVAEQCLQRLPFPSLPAARSVSTAWNSLLSDPSFHQSSSHRKPYLFVAVFRRHPSTPSPITWLAFDTLSRLWLPRLPSMPLPFLSPSSFSSASLSGSLFVLDGILRTFTRYHPRTNRWSPAASIPTDRRSVVLGAVGGRIVAVGGGAPAEAYDPELDMWTEATRGRVMEGIEEPYDAAVAGGRMYVTEGWRWPFDRLPKGKVYGSAEDGAAAMGEGMREGWTGGCAVVDRRVMVVEGWGEGRVKVYDPEGDTWRGAEGGRLPSRVGKPAAICGGKREVYVVGKGMSVAIGAVMEEEGKERWKVEWDVVEGPTGLGEELYPCRCHVIYT